MKKTAFACIVFAAALGCGPGRTTFATFPGAKPAFDRTASDAKALELADKVIANAGGADAWAKAKQVRWSEIVANDGKPVLQAEEAWDRWNARHYARLAGESGDIVARYEIYGEHDEAFSDSSGKLNKLPIADTNRIVKSARERWQFDTAILCMPYLLEAPGAQLKYIGTANADGDELEAIKLSFDPSDKARAGTSYQIDIDAKTGTIARIEIVKDGGNIGYKLSNWKDIAGLKFPTTENNIGMASEVITFKDVKIGDPEEPLYSSF